MKVASIDNAIWRNRAADRKARVLEPVQHLETATRTNQTPAAQAQERSEMIASMKWTRWQVVGLLAIVLVYLALATHRIARPGLYYDEMLFVGPATHKSPYLKCFGLPLLTFPYIGALKAWLYTPIFGFFGVSPMTVRLPVILVACGTLVVQYLFVRRALGPGWATAFTAACSIHPGFVFLTKVDWGPVSLMFFFKSLCLLLLFSWFRSDKTFPWFFFGACLLGFFDKFNFVWFLVALAIATPVIYGRELLAKIRQIPRRLLLISGGGVALVGLLASWVVVPLLQTPHIHGLSTRIRQEFLEIWHIQCCSHSRKSQNVYCSTPGNSCCRFTPIS